LGEKITAVDEWGREEGSDESADSFFRATQDFLTDGAVALMFLTVVVVAGGATLRRCFGGGGGGSAAGAGGSRGRAGLELPSRT